MPEHDSKTQPDQSQRDLFGWFTAILFSIILTALVVMMLAGTMPAGLEFSIDRAMFAVLNAITLTGFQMSIASIDQYQPVGQGLMFTLMFVSAVLWLTSGGCAAIRILGMGVSDRSVLVHATVWTIGLTLVGTVPLCFGDRTLVQAGFLALSSFSNAGLTLGATPGSTHWQMWIAILPMSVLGGVGLPVLIELWLRIRNGRPLSAYSWTVLRLAAIVFLIGTGIQIAVQSLAGGVGMSDIAGAAAMSLNSRSLGLPVDAGLFGIRALPWIVMLLMLVGAGSASCGGGLKATTILELVRGVRASLDGKPPQPVFGVACVTVVSMMLLIAVCFVALMTTQPQLSSDRLLFLSISAATGTGLSQDPISIVGSGLFVLSNTMLLGKLVPLMILWWMVTKTPRAQTLVA
jgi:Trk-type K+ transport system membrane component